MVTLNDYLTNLASEAPAPGGGSAAMVVGAAGCSLVAMVARICLGSRRYEAVRDAALHVASKADALRERLQQLRLDDECAYEAVVAARGDKEAMQRALRAAAAVPLDGARTALQVLDLANDALALGNVNLISDVGCAAEFGFAAVEACAYNVRINHKFMKDAQTVQTQSDELRAIERRASALLHALRERVNSAFS